MDISNAIYKVYKKYHTNTKTPYKSNKRIIQGLLYISSKLDNVDEQFLQFKVLKHSKIVGYRYKKKTG